MVCACWTRTWPRPGTMERCRCWSSWDMPGAGPVPAPCPEGVRVAIAAQASPQPSARRGRGVRGNGRDQPLAGGARLGRSAARPAGVADDEVGAIGSFTDDDPLIVSAGGSAFFDLVVDRLGGRPVGRASRAGGPSRRLLSDPRSRLLQRGLAEGRLRTARSRGFMPALELWGAVLSRPQAGPGDRGLRQARRALRSRDADPSARAIDDRV